MSESTASRKEESTNSHIPVSSVVVAAWRAVFEQIEVKEDPYQVSSTTSSTDAFLKLPLSSSEQALVHYLEKLAKKCDSEKIKRHKVKELLKKEIFHKQKYMLNTWGIVEAMAIVSKTDEKIIQLQEMKKKNFIDPLSWDFLPHHVVLVTCKAVLLLFNITIPSTFTDEQVWQQVWALWIVKNIDAHESGWEWMSTNEPTGLFTKPYNLSSNHLEQVYLFLEEAKILPDEHPAWRRMKVYLYLRDWAISCYEYVHMQHHLLQGFPSYKEVKKLIKPPRKTLKDPTYIAIETPEGVIYYYHRVTQTVSLEKPDQFDGGKSQRIEQISLLLQQLINDALINDPSTRFALERQCKERQREKLLAMEEWVECIDEKRQMTFYYSFKLNKITYTPPEAYRSYKESIGYLAVVRMQVAYRKRLLKRRLEKRKLIRSSLSTTLGMHSSVARLSKFY
jgi:hypothetical protein